MFLYKNQICWIMSSRKYSVYQLDSKWAIWILDNSINSCKYFHVRVSMLSIRNQSKHSQNQTRHIFSFDSIIESKISIKKHELVRSSSLRLAWNFYSKNVAWTNKMFIVGIVHNKYKRLGICNQQNIIWTICTILKFCC